MPSPTFPGRALLLALLVSLPSSGTAQEGRIGFEAGWARRFPPSGTDAVQASYALAGLSADYRTALGSGAWLSVVGGRALDDVGSDWGSVSFGSEGWWTPVGRLDLGTTLDGYGFAVDEPYTYRAWAGTVRPRLRVRAGRLHLLAHVEAGGGHSRIEARITDTDRITRNRLDRAGDTPLIRRAENDLWHRAWGGEVRLLSGPVLWSAGATGYDTRAGRWRRASGSVAGALLGTVWQAFVSSWSGPAGDELTGGLLFQVPLGGSWSARASGLRTEPDPLVHTSGAPQGGLILRWDGLRFAAPATPIYAVEGEPHGERAATFRLEADDAATVELVGDFSDWSPVPMQRDGDTWTARVGVRPGLYHFGFLVDGEWYLPEKGVPGRVSDEWGRENGTLVVPGRDDETMEDDVTDRAARSSSGQEKGLPGAGCPGADAR
ncbi:MAG: glycogen-binding domain-containing protein [Gemmatimonadota bacterium]